MIYHQTTIINQKSSILAEQDWRPYEIKNIKIEIEGGGEANKTPISSKVLNEREKFESKKLALNFNHESSPSVNGNSSFVKNNSSLVNRDVDDQAKSIFKKSNNKSLNQKTNTNEGIFLPTEQRPSNYSTVYQPTNPQFRDIFSKRKSSPLITHKHEHFEKSLVSKRNKSFKE